MASADDVSKTTTDFAALIAGIQASTGWTQREIAQRARISHATVGRFAAGKAQHPTFDAVERLERLAAKVVRKA